MPEIDRWALDELARLIARVNEAWDAYELHQVYGQIHNFCAVTMSSIYLDVLKDRLYCSAMDWPARRSAQTVLHSILLALCKMTAPILVHTAEEVWDHVEHRDEQADSVHLCRWPEPQADWLDEELHGRWQTLLAVRDDVLRAVERLREEKSVSQGMEVGLTLGSTSDELRALLLRHRVDLLELLMVSELNVMEAAPSEGQAAGMVAGQDAAGLLVQAVPSPHAKCARCWNLRETVGRDAEHADLCERCARAVGEGG